MVVSERHVFQAYSFTYLRWSRKENCRYEEIYSKGGIFCLQNFEFFEKNKDFLTPGVDYLSHIWHNFLEFWILNALQLCIYLAF